MSDAFNFDLEIKQAQISHRIGEVLQMLGEIPAWKSANGINACHKRKCLSTHATVSLTLIWLATLSFWIA